MRIPAMVLTAVLVLSGCSQAGGGGGDENQASSPPPADNGGAGGLAGVDWKGTLLEIGQSFAGGEKGFMYYAFDSLAYPGKPVDLAVRLQHIKSGLAGAAGVKVEYLLGSKVLGSAVTDSDGLATFQWTPPAEPNVYTLSARVVEAPKDYADAAQLTPAELVVAAWPKEHPLAILDLDHTVVDDSFWKVIVLGAGKAMPRSVEVTRRIAGKYGIVYLTHRPDLLTHKSKDWLIRNGYPAGPLLVSKLTDAFGDSGVFKTGKLAALKKSFPNAAIGIGDKMSDAQAYVDNGLTAYLIPDYNPDKVKDLRQTAEAIDDLKGRGRLNVVSGWEQIEKGIFSDTKYPPADFAKGLRARAKQLDD